MAHQRKDSSIEWGLLDQSRSDQMMWESGAAAPARPPAPRAGLAWSSFGRRVVLPLVVLALAGAGWLWLRLAQTQALVHRDVQYAVTQELLALQTQSADEFRTLVDPRMGRAWQNRELGRFQWFIPVLPAHALDLTAQVEQVKQLDLRAEARVIYQQGTTGPRFRETVFFAQRDPQSKWQRTAADLGAWGEPIELETPNFRFLYHTRDAQTVGEVSTEVEAFYRRVQQDLGQSGESAPFIISIAPHHPAFQTQQGRRFDILPPEILIDSADAPLAATLRWMVGFPVANDMILNHWKATGMMPALAPLWHPLAHWEAEDWHGGRSWWWHAQAGLLREAQAAGVSLAPDEIIPGTDTHAAALRTARNFFLIDYVVTRFGRPLLPATLQGLHTHTTWEATVPSVFGVAYSDFVAGWQAHLKKITMPSSPGASQ